MTEKEDCECGCCDCCCGYTPDSKRSFLSITAIAIRAFLDKTLPKMVKSYEVDFSKDFGSGELIMRLNVELKDKDKQND